MLAVLRDVQKDEIDRHPHRPLASCRRPFASAGEWADSRIRIPAFLNEENGLQPGKLELASLPATMVCGRTCWEREKGGEGDGGGEREQGDREGQQQIQDL